MMLRAFSATLLVSVAPMVSFAQAPTVRIGVLGLFHTHELVVAPEGDTELLVSAGDKQMFLRARSECSSVAIRQNAEQLAVHCGEKVLRGAQIRFTGRNQQAASFVLTLPGKVTRRYEGLLEIKAEHGELISVITMDLETAVASIVRAESNPGTPLEALEAQAVVSRSYLVANKGRHKNFDFCDLTHCQALREPPAPPSPSAEAAAATRGLVLTFEGRVVASMFTRSCGGRTRTPQELGLPPGGYPYFAVACAACQADPVRWSRRLSAEDAALLSSKGEAGRLALCRKLGWNSVPSNSFTARDVKGEVQIDGV